MYLKAKGLLTLRNAETAKTAENTICTETGTCRNPFQSRIIWTNSQPVLVVSEPGPDILLSSVFPF